MMVVTLSGENMFALQAALRQLSSEFLKKYGDMGLERLDGEEVSLDRIQASLQSLPFLVERRLVILRSPSANKRFIEVAERLLSDVSETTDVIIFEPKLDKRSTYYKFLKKSTDFREFTSLDAHGLARWLVDEAKSNGGSISMADAGLLVGRIGEDQQLLSQELTKLLIYDPVITRQSIELLTEASPQSTVFELLEAAFSGDTKRMLAIYKEQREQKVDPSQIIAMLTWQLRVLALLKAAGSRSAGEIAREAKVSPFVVQKNQTIAKRLTPIEVKRLVADLLAIDVRSKRESIDLDEALQDYLLTLHEKKTAS